MKISVNHLKRYQEIALLLWKHGRSDLVRQMGIDEALDPQAQKPAGEGEATPDQLAADLEAMGPTYVKLGQVLSSRPDLLPEPYLYRFLKILEEFRITVQQELNYEPTNPCQTPDPQPSAHEGRRL